MNSKKQSGKNTGMEAKQNTQELFFKHLSKKPTIVDMDYFVKLWNQATLSQEHT